MLNFEAYKGLAITIQENKKTISDLYFLIECKNEKEFIKNKSKIIVEASDNSSEINKWMTNPKEAGKEYLKGIPIVGGLFNSISNGATIKKIDKLKAQYEKVYSAMQTKLFAINMMADKAKHNTKTKGEDSTYTKQLESIKTRFTEQLTTITTDWDTAIGEIEDDSKLEKQKKTEKTVAIAAIKAKVAEALIKKDEDIAMKKLGFTQEQIDKFKQTVKDGQQDLDALEKEADKTNEDPTKEMSSEQKSKANSIKEETIRVGGILSEITQREEKGGEFEKENGKKRHELLAKYMAALHAYAKGIGTKADEWDGPDHGKPENFDEIEKEAKDITVDDVISKPKAKEETNTNTEGDDKLQNANPDLLKRLKDKLNKELQASDTSVERKKEIKDKIAKIDKALAAASNESVSYHDMINIQECMIEALESILFE